MSKLLRTTGWFALVIGVVLAILRATFVTWWTVPSDDPLMGASLAPSLFPGDFVLLWKGNVKFGDLARCADPEAPGRFIVGRVMGEPGDELEIKGSEISVNDKRGVHEHTCNPNTFTIPDPTSGADTELTCGIESVINHKHLRAIPTNSVVATTRKVTVGQGQFYLISDNRVYPLDSRDYGGVPKATCKEFVFFRVKGKKGWGDATSRMTYIQ